MMRPHGQGEKGSRQCGHLDNGQGSILCDFVRMSFMDDPDGFSFSFKMYKILQQVF